MFTGVCLSTGGCLLPGGAWSGGGLLPGGAWSGGRGGAWSRGFCWGGVPGGDPPDGYCCGWYASYWSAFLFFLLSSEKIWARYPLSLTLTFLLRVFIINSLAKAVAGCGSSGRITILLSSGSPGTICNQDHKSDSVNALLV